MKTAAMGVEVGGENAEVLPLHESSFSRRLAIRFLIFIMETIDIVDGFSTGNILQEMRKRKLKNR